MCIIRTTYRVSYEVGDGGAATSRWIDHPPPGGHRFIFFIRVRSPRFFFFLLRLLIYLPLAIYACWCPARRTKLLLLFFFFKLRSNVSNPMLRAGIPRCLDMILPAAADFRPSFQGVGIFFTPLLHASFLFTPWHALQPPPSPGSIATSPAQVMHFSPNYPNPTDPLGQLGTDVPPETHAIKFYPPTDAVVPMPTVAYPQLEAPRGWRSCDNCRIPEEDLSSTLLVCGGCTLPNYWRAHYCR